MSNKENKCQPKNKDFYNGAWHLTIDNQVIEVSEEVYHVYKQPLCNECQHQEQKTRSVLSLDKFTDDGLDLPDAINIFEIIADKLLLEDLYASLEELHPENRRIAQLVSMGKTDREIAKCIGRSEKTVSNRKTLIFAQLRKRLKDWG